MRWKKAHNSRKRRIRRWYRVGQYAYRWPNLRQNWEKWCRDNEGVFFVPHAETTDLITTPPA